uniref:Retrotransposon gag domain-containing protein n=1 Tax=Tanacetum cinerariifolium TaxID=118510 RepID=A0A699GMK8_TANCI|nr:hypothetical protein [Tanacetum cinerariifolium]
MRTRSSSNLPVVSPSNPSTSNPKRQPRGMQKQLWSPDQRTMAELLRAPTEGTTNLRNEISNFQQRFNESFHEAWDRYKDLLRACPPYSFTQLHQLDTFYNALNPADQDSLNAAASGNLLERRTQYVLTIIENKSKCLAAGGNTFPELRDNIKGYVSAAAVNYNQGSGYLPSNTVASPNGKLKAITTRSGLVLDGPIVPTPPLFINPDEDEHVEETLTDPDHSKYTIKVPPPPVQKYKPPSQIDFVVHPRDPLHPNIPYPSRILKQKQQEKDEYQKMHKALLLNIEKLQELANTPLNEICSAVMLKKLPKKLGDPGLPELISTRMTLELANRAICTPAGIARDVFVSVGKFTFPADFVIVDYESDPRVPFILGRPFLRIAHALINVHGEEMILHDGDERMTLNMRHDTSSYSNQPQKESINLINVVNNSSGDFLEDLFSHQPSGNPTFSSHPKLKMISLIQREAITTYSSSPLLEELANEVPLITFPLKYDDDLQFNVEFDLKEIEFLLHQDTDSSLKDSIDQNNLANPADNFIDSVPEMFTDEHALDFSSPLIFDEYDDDFLEVESDTEKFYDDPFDSKGEKIKKVDAKPSTNNKDKVFNLGILSQENPFEIITHVVQDKKLATSNASLVLEDFDPPLYELPFFKDSQI